MIRPEERRSEPRVLRDDDVMVTILAAPAEPALVGTTVKCSTVDVSASGLSLLLDKPLAAGSRLGLEVEVKEYGTCYFLGGAVAWTHPSEQDGQHMVGVGLLDDQCFDVDRWRHMFSAP